MANNKITDAQLDDFFNEIEKLDIGSGDVDENDDEKKKGRVLVAQGGGDSSLSAAEQSTSTAEQRGIHRLAAAITPPRDNNKDLAIQRAEQSAKSWQEFKIPSKSEAQKSEERPKISFTLLHTKKKKNKKNGKASSNPLNKSNETNLHHLQFLPPPDIVESNDNKPEWIAVLDTCALMESLDAVGGLLTEASSSLSSIEPLTIVVPYKLWSELDYQSKLQQGEEKQQQARRAVRMLNRSIQQEQDRQRAMDATTTAWNPDNAVSHAATSTTRVAIRSQSRQEMNQAAMILGLNHGDANNDDHILCCARAEQTRLEATKGGPLSAGGVVLLTLDHVLSGKARADHVMVYTPKDFLDYYRRREVSLRQRMQQ